MVYALQQIVKGRKSAGTLRTQTSHVTFPLLDGFLLHWGPPCSDDPVSNTEVTGALVAGRGHGKKGAVPHATRITPVASIMQDVEKSRREVPHKEELLQKPDPACLQTTIRKSFISAHRRESQRSLFTG